MLKIAHTQWTHPRVNRQEWFEGENLQVRCTAAKLVISLIQSMWTMWTQLNHYISHHITSYHIISHHITSCHIISHHITSYQYSSAHCITKRCFLMQRIALPYFGLRSWGYPNHKICFVNVCQHPECVMQNLPTWSNADGCGWPAQGFEPAPVLTAWALLQLQLAAVDWHPVWLLQKREWAQLWI